MSPTPSAISTPVSSAPSVTPGSSVTPTAKAPVVLAGDGIAGHRFGQAEGKVVATLEARLGQAEEVQAGVLCELDSGSPWSKTLNYGGLSVLFVARTKSRSAPRTLTAWSFQAAEALGPSLAIADDVPLNLTFAQLQAAYPKGVLEDSGLGDGGQIFTLPNKIRLMGTTSPDLAQGGELLFCE